MRTCSATALVLVLCAILSLHSSSCSSQRALTKEERRVPPAMLETAYNLVRAKLVRLGLAQRVDVEIDSSQCERRYYQRYDTWLAEVLGIGQQVAVNVIRYFLTVRGKPYFTTYKSLHLEDNQKLSYTRQLYGNQNQLVCLETVPDTALASIHFGKFFLRSCEEDYLPIRVEEAIVIVRRTFGLDSTFSCIHAFPFKESMNCYTGNNATESTSGFWRIEIELEPSDITAYYQYKAMNTMQEEEIVENIKTQKKQEFICKCPEALFRCDINVQTGRICNAACYLRNPSDVFSPLPERLKPLEERLNAIRDSLAKEYLRE
ncbi:MAG: hypothetical protein JNN25_06820 [Candidatus Kapabacteria bacterium]|nr:hypothetical protein [Candidatus Kapabacteria bacterium]